MRVAQVVRGLETRLGGPPRAVASLTTALRKVGVESTVFATAPRATDDQLVPVPDAAVRMFKPGWFSTHWPGFSLDMARELKRDIGEYDLIHVQELWHYPNYSATKAASTSGVPFVVSPLGGHAPIALGKARLKKVLFDSFAQRGVLKRARGFHAMTEHEAQDIQRKVAGVPVDVIPLGVDPDEFSSLPDPAEFEIQVPEIEGKRVVLFMGRIDAVKGLDVLINGFGLATENRDDLHLVIAGPDFGYEGAARDLVDGSKLNPHVSFVGPIYGTARMAAFARADIFALTSRGEGFSVAILESLAASLPVIISEECHFPSVASSGAGLEIPLDARMFAHALTTAMDNPSTLAEMGARARDLATGPYSWDTVGQQFKQFYETSVRAEK